MLPGPYFLLAGAMGFVLLWPLGALFGYMNWPMFHGWGLAHGSVAVAWPLLSLASYIALWAILRKRLKPYTK